jgi:hypothetical protein
LKLFQEMGVEDGLRDEGDWWRGEFNYDIL